MASRLQRSAITGMLVICLLLAAGLVFTAVMSYQAAHRAARDVLLSRAIEAASSFASTARVTRVLGDQAKLQALARELSSLEVAIAVIDARPSHSFEALRDLRLQGQTHRLVSNGDGAGYLEYWQPLRGGRRRWGRRGAWGGKRWWGPRRGPAKLLRVRVRLSVAEPLLGPAKITAAMAAVVSLVLLVLGVIMHRAARRAQRAEQELQRRRALSALGEMAAVLAHEIRTPLSSIKGNAQLVGESWPEDQRIQAMVREAGRLERLVNGLLDYARPADPRRIASDPDQIMTQAAEIVAPSAAAKSVSLVTDPAGCGVCLEADSDQIVQVLVNLLQNAVESCSAPEAQGETVVAQVRQGRGQIQFTVLDSGPGFKQMDLGQVARPFFSTKDRGTGLGLSVARQIVEQHGGELSLWDRREGGAAVRVTLPQTSGTADR